MARAQVGKGTFYLYFKSKEELVDFVLEEFIGEIRQTLSWVYSSIGEDLEKDKKIDLAAIFQK
jgi:AcrR family transcriptional regulator